jgi:hypothetical protein
LYLFDIHFIANLSFHLMDCDVADCMVVRFTLIMNPAKFVVPVPSQDLDFQYHMSWSFCVQWFQVRDGCYFCWQLFKILFSFVLKYMYITGHIVSLIPPVARCTRILKFGLLLTFYIMIFLNKEHLYYQLLVWIEYY